MPLVVVSFSVCGVSLQFNSMASFIDDNCSSSNPIHTKNKRKRKGNNRKKENPKSLIPCSIGGGGGGGGGYSLTIHGHDAAALLSLPEDILILIVKKLDCVGFHRFSAACRFFWYSVAAAAKKMQMQIQIRRLHQKNQFPWLMLSFHSFRSPENPLCRGHILYPHRGFFSAFHGKVFTLGTPAMMPDPLCCGSNMGCLIMFGWITGRMFLFNPFTGVRIELPHKSTLPRPSKAAQQVYPEYIYKYSDKFISKVMLLSPPAPAAAANHSHSNSTSNSDDGNNNNNNIFVHDCLVLVFYWRNRVAFCRPGDKAWTAFTKQYVADEFLTYQDFIVYHGKLYAIKYNYDLVLVELGGPDQPKETNCNIAPPRVEQVDIRRHQNHDDQCTYLYLVECHGELLMVIRWVKILRGRLGYNDTQTTLMLEIFKLETQHLRWVKVEDLGDQMLFVGTSTSFSLSSLHCPGFRGNCVYFTDGYLSVNRGPEVGMFHLEDNSFEPFYTTDHSDEFLPIWFDPISW